ncbi:hypothetical protein ACTFSJ_27595 [Bacillus cereus group sp. MYBK12-2]|uniref:hypothetical protein n=1 Tax=Bacillus cereus group sp. MYBK12-2 TaxID=3450689 RepID=UPI0032F8035D|nr:hypothetical protein [Bacillus pacificus]HDR7653559.1 hypothetical protein [Bacillus pacificus]
MVLTKDHKIEIVQEMFKGKEFTKENLVYLLSATLVNGGLSLDQIDGIVNDWSLIVEVIQGVEH